MKKNGFIATSLIYSFFLIFITLFLTIIADYLQNKVLLNTIEKGIKDELNSTMSIEDFEVGDMINFVKNCDDETIKSINNQWIVANVNYNDKKVVFYSHDFLGEGPAGFINGKEELTYDNLENDIEFGYRNNTYFTKIIYTFSRKVDDNEYTSYKLGEDKYASITGCSSPSDQFDTDIYCINNTGSNKTRYRLEKEITIKYTKCIPTDAYSSIILNVGE